MDEESTRERSRPFSSTPPLTGTTTIGASGNPNFEVRMCLGRVFDRVQDAPHGAHEVRKDTSMIFKTTVESPLGTLRIIATDEGLRAVLWPQNDEKRLRLDSEPVERTNHPVLVRAERQLAEYFAGQRHAFDVPLEPVGTPFQLSAWSGLREIPYGETWTYGRQAAAIGRPRAPRAVGAANGQNPLSIFVPCHRVIGADGSLTGYAGGLESKRFLLALEQG